MWDRIQRGREKKSRTEEEEKEDIFTTSNMMASNSPCTPFFVKMCRWEIEHKHAKLKVCCAILLIFEVKTKKIPSQCFQNCHIRANLR